MLIDVTPSYTEESLASYNKQELIKLFWEVQQQSNETISKLTNEIKLLKKLQHIGIRNIGF